MRLTKRFRGVGLVIISLLLASLTLSAQTQKWNSEDWDDDLVLDSVEDNYDVLSGNSEKDPYIPGKLDPKVGPLAADRALVLSAAPNGVKLPVATRFMPSSDFTVEFWYSPVADSSNANGALFSYAGDKNAYSIDVADGVLTATIGGKTIGSASLAKYATKDAVKANPFDNNIWNYIALTWKCEEDNSYTATLYLNGTSVRSVGSFSALDVDISSEAFIGKGCANGYIDEFSFWSKALTASEISADYNSGNGKISYYAEGDKHGLVCYYRFDDGGESIEDYAYLPDFEAAAALDPSKSSELDKLTEMFQYRVMAADSGVRTTALYKDAEKTELIQKGQPIWVTNLAVSMPEPEILRTKEADVDSDYDGFVNDGDDALDNLSNFAIVRMTGDDALKPVKLQGGNFIVYDDLGQALWIVKGFDKTCKLDAPQPEAGNKIATIKQFAANLSGPEYDFTNGLDDDGDGVIDDTCIAKGNLAAAVKPAISDADDDGIIDNDESKGIDPLCKAKITNPYYSTSPLYNRVLDLTDTGTRYASPEANYTSNNMNINGFTLELWYKLTEKPDGSATKYPLIYKTNVKPTLPGDFWFGFEQDEKDENKMKLTVKYRTVANTTTSEAVARYTLNEIDLLDPENGWVHVAVTVTEDTTNADAMKVNFVVYANDSEYKSDVAQLAGIIGAGSGRLDGVSANKNGKLIIGSTKSAESLKMFVDEVRIWNGVRSATQLASGRHMFLDSNMPVTYYRFDDGANVSGRYTAQDFAVDQAGTSANTTDAVLNGKAKLTTLPSAMQGDETFEYLNADTDKDKMPDFWEIASFQSLVNYAISSSVHATLLGYAGSGNVYGYTDYDGDGLNDYYEFRSGHDPMVDDTNATTYNETTGKDENDLTEYDADGDGLTLLEEQKNGTNPNEYNNIDEGGTIVADTDDDGVSDDDEDTGNTGDDAYGYTVYELTGKYDPLSPLVWRALIAGGSEADKLIVPENPATVYGANTDANNVEAQNWTLETWFILGDDTSNTGSLIRRVRKDGEGTYFDLGLENGVPYVKATMKNEFPVKEGEEGNKNLTKELVLKPTTGGAIAKNTWTHFAAEWDARHQTMSLYINGTIAGSVYCFGAPLIDGGDYTQFTTEVLADFDGKYLKGHIDEIRIWTYASETQNGIRRPHQLKEWMSKALPVLRTNAALNNPEHIADAYFRFDDGGKYAQNFSMIADQTDPASYYTMTLQDADGNDADLSARMESVWDKNEDGSLKSYDEANIALRAINMSGAGNDEFDPIPDGWKQIYWPNNNVGSKYDFNTEYILGNANAVPYAIPGENSFFVDPLTGTMIHNNVMDGGGTQEAYIYFADIYFNDVSYLESVVLSGRFGEYACESTGNPATNQIIIFVNGERIGYSSDSNGNAGEDIDQTISRQVSGNNSKGNFAWMTSSKSPIDFSHDIKNAMVKGRNRVTIFVNHYYTGGCSTAHSHGYSFYAKIRANGRILDNEMSHVKWFQMRQIPRSSDRSLFYQSINIYQEDTDHCHAKQKDGVTDLLYFWFEKYYGVQPWAYDQDPDGDGLTNWTEYLANTNPLSKVNGDDLMFDSERDRDGDKLNNQIEQYLETLPNIADTDDDGVDDYTENTSGYNPLDSASAPNRKNLALALNGRTVFSIPEVGDVSGQDNLSQWTIEAWIKPKYSDGRSGDEETDQKRQVILARTVGRYSGVDCTNYELGLTEEGLPYAGFTVVKDKYENGKLVGVESSHIYAEMTLKDGFTKLGDDAWTHVAASFTPMSVDEKTGTITNGKIDLYVDGQLAYTLNNVSDIAPTTYRGVSGLTIGMPLPQDGEVAALADDETAVIGNSFIGSIDNLAVWTKVRTADEIKETQTNGLVNIVKQSKTFLYYNWKVPVPYLRTDENLLHAFTFDDGGTSIENYAWKQDWYNGFAHAIPMPLDVNMEEAAAEDEERNASDLTDTDGDGMPDEWEEKYGLDPADPSDAAGDLDGDGVSNLYEYMVGTDPTVARSENVVNSAGAEKPDDVNDADWDPDGDGLTNFYEQLLGTNPMDADTDDDGVADGDEYSVIPDQNGDVRPMKDNTSPIHSMNRHADPADLTSETFVNRALNLSMIGKGKSGGLTIPQPDDDTLDDMAAWTIETWFRYECAKDDVNGALFRRKIGNLIGFELGLEAAVPYINYTTERGTKIEKKYTAAIPASQWVHLAATWNPETRKLMLIVDGSSAVTYEHSKSAADYLPVNANGLVTIADPKADESTGTAKDWKEGIYMDEIRIWNVARTVRQIGESMDELIQTGAAGLVRYYRFDDGGKSIEDFAHPGWKNAANYAIPANRYKVEVVNGTAEWVTDGTFETPAIRGIDDADGDNMPDWFEFVYNLDDPNGDEDGDTLTNLYEYLCGTDPTDTTNGFDDYNAVASAGDMANGDKQFFGLDPRLADSDGDGISDIDEIEGNLDGAFARADEESYSSNPLSPLSTNDRYLKHFVFSGSPIVIKNQAAHAMDSWTVMATVKASSTGEATIFKREVSENVFNFKLGWMDGGLLYASFGDETEAEDAKVIRAPQLKTLMGDDVLAIAQDEWTNIAASYDADKLVLTLYVNGMPVAETKNTKKIACPGTGDGVFGGEYTGAKFTVGDGFTGSMDSIRVYPTALSGEQIARDYTVAANAKEGKAAAYGEGEANFTTYEPASSMMRTEHVAGQLIVKFKNILSDADIQMVTDMVGATMVKQLKLTGAYLVELPEKNDVRLAAAVEDYRWIASEEIEYVVPNYMSTIAAVPNDPYFNKQWGLTNTGQGTTDDDGAPFIQGEAGHDINVQPLWDAGFTGSHDVVVAVIDTGVDYNHPDLKNNILYRDGKLVGYDFINDDDDPMDDHHHGTHCAGIIGAVGNNRIGVTGINWNVSIMPLKAADAEGHLPSDAVISCIEYAVANGANIISCSYGGYIYDEAQYDAMRKALDYGVLFCCAAGNDRQNLDVTPCYPACYGLANIISVAASDPNDDLAEEFSNYGAKSVHVAAPGCGIFSTFPENNYAGISGTSMATPMVSGVAALLKSAFPNATSMDLKEAILGGVDVVDSLKGKVTTGGRVNAYNSLMQMSSRDAVLCLRANAVFNGKAYDLTKIELGATAKGVNGKAPELGRYLADASAVSVEATAFEDFKYFAGDSDGDGIADWLEVALGLDPGTPDGELDYDADGLTNYFEAMTNMITADAAYADVALSPWNAQTNGADLDYDLTNAALGGKQYAYLQNNGFHPLTGIGDYADWNRDDDKFADTEEEETNAGNPLQPYVAHILKLTDGAYVELPNQPRFATDESWSVDAWVKISQEDYDNRTNGATRVIMSREIDADLDGTFELVNYELGIEAKAAGWFAYARYTTGAKSVVKIVSTMKLVADEWTHVGATFNAEARKLTIAVNNGAPNPKSTATAVPAAKIAGISRVRIGSEEAGKGFIGEIDAVRFWNIAKADFSDYMQADMLTMSSTPLLSMGLVAYYIFDDGGETAQDFAVALDDWSIAWPNAGILNGAEMVEGVSPVTPSEKDSDGDGIPDWWEKKYGLNPEDPADAEEDPDGDGLPNLYEYLTGNDPFNEDTDGNGTTDDWEDYDGDGLTNGEEVVFSTRPDDPDTDDDGFTDACETGYDWFDAEGNLVEGVGYDYGVSATASLSQPNETFTSFALNSDIAKVFRMNGENRMTVANNRYTTGNKITISFWFRPTKTASSEVTFLRRTVTDEKGYSNYAFSFDGQSIYLNLYAKGASVPTKVAYKPASGFKEGNWYLIAAIIDAGDNPVYEDEQPAEGEGEEGTEGGDAAAAAEGEGEEEPAAPSTKSVTLIGFSGTLNTSTNEYVYTAKSASKNLSFANGLNVGENGNLILGVVDAEKDKWTDAVLDVDNLYIWNVAKTVADIKTLVENTTIGTGDITTGLVAQYLFDDGGETAEDFCRPEDWWNNWQYAGVLNIPTEQPDGENLGCGMILDSSLSDFSNDKDKDGLPDDWEIFYFGDLEQGANDDPDGDGLTNLQEYNLSAGMRDASDTDTSYSNQYAWLNPTSEDSDGDGLPDAWEAQYPSILNPLDPNDANLDSDGDGLTNWKEYLYGTDPTMADTDQDGLPDGWEVQYTASEKDEEGNPIAPSLNPLSADDAYGADGDPDGDGYTNADEYLFGTNPIVADSPDADTDGDGVKDVIERKPGVNTDSSLTDTDDDEEDDDTEISLGTKGYDSTSKSSLASFTNNFMYEGNKVAQFNTTHGTLTVPAANDPDRIGFSSWTVEARFRHTDIDSKDYTVYLVRRSYSNSSYNDDEKVDDENAAWNYAIGYEVKDGELYPFVSFKAHDGAQVRKVASDMPLEIESGKTDWHFVTGVYDSIAKQMYLYVDGEMVAAKVFKSITTAAEQSPSTAKLAGGYDFTTTKIGEIFVEGDDSSTVMIDEVRIWGLKPNSVEADGTNTGYIANFVRGAAEITDGHFRPVTPIEGVYDGGLADIYATTDDSGEPLGGNTVDYAVDNHVSDGAWTTKTGTIGTRAIVSYHDENDNGIWDPGEDIWRDQTLAEAIAIAQAELGEGYDPTVFEKLTDADVTTAHYEDNVDVKLAQGKNGWKPGTAYTRTIVNGTTTSTVSITAEQSAEGKELVVYYIDKNNNGQIDAEDDFWVDYDAARDVETWYAAAPCGWAKRMGLALYYRFDDGGGSIEDYAWQADWRSSPVWAHAIRPTGLTGFFPPKKPTDKGGMDNAYQYVTETMDDGFAWVIDAYLSPVAPTVEIYTLSSGESAATEAYIPKNGTDIYDYDVLSGHVKTDAVDPEGGNITYLYYWLKGDGWDGRLSYIDGALNDNADTDGVVSDIIAVGKELDLFAYADSVNDGDIVTLAVVAKSESGMASPVALATIAIAEKDNALADPVLFSHYSAKIATAGKAITVTLKVQDKNAGTVVINWYRNLVLFSSASQTVSAGAAGRTVTFTIKGDSVVDGDVWGYKAYFQKKSDGSLSRTTPPESKTGNEWIFCPVGRGYDEEFNAVAKNSAPSIPKSVVITPEDVDENSMLIATPSGSNDPDGDKFSYMYQWYQNGELVVGEDKPYFPSLLEGKTITELDGETTTSLSATSISEGDIIVVRVWAVDVYGNASNKLLSDPVVIGPDLADINEDISDAGTIYAYEPNNTSKKATRLLPKADWLDAGDANVQEHYFCDKFDVDWFWFIVPQTMTDSKSIVKIETNNGDSMFYPTHYVETGREIDDTYMELYNSNLKRIASNDDTRLEDGRGTIYARMEVELDPGIYYVRVSRSGSGYYATMWTMHLGITSERGSQGPAFDALSGSVVLTPEFPNDGSELVCTATGAASSSGRDCDYYYVWYRNGEIVPFGTAANVTAWSTERYVISQAKNFYNDGKDPNVIDAKYTKPGDIWWCDVYARDSYGYSQAFQSNWVIIEGGTQSWSLELEVYKSFRKAGLGTVSGTDQSVVIGMDDNATFGFDPSLDIAAATRTVPGTDTPDPTPLPLGAAYSIGMDNTCTRLTQDIRPTERSSVWYIRIDMGDARSSINGFSMSWTAAQLPETAVGNLKLTRMLQLTDKTWTPISDTTIDMTEQTSVTLTEADFESLQQDEYGQYYAVYRVSLGGADEAQTISLKPGWNMISFAVTPLLNSVDEVFTVDMKKLIRGNAWRFEGGQYVAASTVNAGVGYWVYANITKATTLTIYGNRPSDGLELKEGWNLVGPLYNVAKASKTYKELYNTNGTGVISYIYKAISDKSGNIQYENIENDGSRMSIGNAYWIYCTKDVLMPFLPTED